MIPGMSGRWAKFGSLPFRIPSFASLTKPHEKAKKLVSSTSKQAVVWISTDAIVQQLTLPHPGLFGSLAQSCQSIARCEPEQGSQKLHPCGATETHM